MSLKLPKEYLTSQGVKTLVSFLRSQNGIKLISGVENNKEVVYFEGKALIDCILSAPNWPNSLPRITEHNSAIDIGDLLIRINAIHRYESFNEVSANNEIISNLFLKLIILFVEI